MRRMGRWISAALVATVSFTACTAGPDATDAPTTDPPSGATATIPVPESELSESDGDVEPVEGAVMSVAPSAVRHGDELDVDIDCPEPSSAKARFRRVDARSTALDDVQRIGTTTPPSSTQSGTLTVPYWLEPGVNVVEGFCDWPMLAPTPAEFEVLAPERGTWDDWRPLVGPRLVAPIPKDAFEEFGSWEYVVSDGESLAVAATCRSGVETDGARFVIWANDVIGDRTIVVEHPVDDVGLVDDEIVIRADITFDAAPFADRVEDFIAISALCTETSGPFDSASEWPPESPEPRLEGKIATIRLAPAETLNE